MLSSLSFIFLIGLAAAWLCRKLGLPRIIGMLLTGILLGPCVLDLLDPSILSVSADLRKIALIIILLKAGLSLDLSDLKKVGRPAFLMSFVPACCEILCFVLFAPAIMGLTRVEAAVMGTVLGAVSPAIVVPRMVSLIENRLGTDQGIPQLILAGASCDDVFVIVLFTAFVGMAQGQGIHAADFAAIPVSILLGAAVGFVLGFSLGKAFESAHRRGKGIRDSIKVIVILGLAFLLTSSEDALKGTIPFSGLISVIVMACTLKLNTRPEVSPRLSSKFGKLWLCAELLLFVLVGAAVDIRYTLQAGLPALGMIALSLLFRSAGVALSTAGTSLTGKERLFCVLAYLPKATVQAAIGGVPLALGLSCGNAVLSTAVLAILITAPLGALAIDRSCRRLLRPSAHT